MNARYRLPGLGKCGGGQHVAAPLGSLNGATAPKEIKE
jgi:hypothetical protein